MKKKREKKNVFIQGTILAAAGMITRVIGFAYRIPMTNMLGSDGNGVYSIAFEIYNIVLMLSSYSMPLAVSKLVSARLALRQYNNSYRVFKDAMLFAICVSTFGMLFLYFGAGFLADLYSTPELVRPLRVLAPTLFVVGILGVVRGYFQGTSTMIPTAISQIFEQIFNAFFSIGAVWFCMSKLTQGVQTFKTDAITSAHGVCAAVNLGYKVQQASYGAAGGTFGTFTGAFIALLFLVFTFFIYKPTIIKRNKRDETGITESHSEVFSQLFFTVIPVVISQTVYQIGYVIDDLIFSKAMVTKGMSNSVRKSLQGVFNSQYTVLINVPIAVATAMAASSIPSIVTSYTRGNIKDANKKTGAIIKFVMVIAFPSAFGLAVLSSPIICTLFRSPSLRAYNVTGARLLTYGSIAIVFYSLSTITSAILQGLDHMNVPVRNSAISLVVHLILMVALLYKTDLNVYALLIGDITFPLLISILNWISVKKYIGYRQEVGKTFAVPLISSAIMGAAAWIVYYLLFIITKSMIIGLLFSIAAAIAVYAVLILALRCFEVSELYELPMGGRLVTLGRKLGFY